MKTSLFQKIGFLSVLSLAPSLANADFYQGDSYDRRQVQGALDNVYVADEMIVRRDYRGAQDQMNSAIMAISQFQDRDFREARRFLFNSIDNLGINDVQARDSLNNAESVFENRLQTAVSLISRQELQSVLDNIYRTDTDIVDGRYGSARNELNAALGVLRRYPQDRDLVSVSRSLENCYSLIGHNDSRARDVLNDGESIIENRLAHFH